MKRKDSIALFVACLMGLLFNACNQDSKTAKTNSDSTTMEKKGNSAMSTYDPAMDPITVEKHLIKLLADTLNVKTYEVTLNPGDTANLHYHPDHLVYVLKGGKLDITLKDQPVQQFDLPTGAGIMFGPETHSGKNNSNGVIKLLVVDIYRPRE